MHILTAFTHKHTTKSKSKRDVGQGNGMAPQMDAYRLFIRNMLEASVYQPTTSRISVAKVLSFRVY